MTQYGCKAVSPYLQFSHFVGQIVPLSLRLAVFDLQLLQLGLRLLLAVLQLTLTLKQRLNLDDQLALLTLQGLLGLVHGRLVLEGTGQNTQGEEVLKKCETSLE